MTDQAQIAQGSLATSHRNTHAIILKKATYEQQEKAIAFLNSKNMDLVIQQRLSEKAEVPLKRGTFFINTYTSKNEPGFIVFLEGCPPIFLKYNLTKREREQTKGNPLCYILRMRVSALMNQGSVFVASIDTVNHKMCIEDVYVWANNNIFEKKTFVERRSYMKEFVEKHWIPDVRLLGGIITNIIQPLPLASFESFLAHKDYMKVVFIPNSPGKRRFTYSLNETVAKISEGFYGRSSGVLQTPVALKPNISIKSEHPAKSEHLTSAKAIRVPMLPDVYDLYDGTISLGRGCVQDLALSKKLNEAGPNIQVKINYTSEFKRYEIVGLDTP